jgi:hypothetical protein
LLACGIFFWLLGLGIWITLHFAKWATQGKSLEDLMPGSATIVIFVAAIVGIAVGLSLIRRTRGPGVSQPTDKLVMQLTRLPVIVALEVMLLVGVLVLLAISACFFSIAT